MVVAGIEPSVSRLGGACVNGLADILHKYYLLVPQV